MDVSTKANKDKNIEKVLKKNHFQQKIFAEQIDLLFRNLSISVPSALLCATIVFVALYRIPHTSLLLYWYMAVIFMSALRLGLARFYLHDRKGTKLHFHQFLITTAIAAALWGFVGSVLMPPKHLIEQMIVIVVIAGVTAGGIQSLQASLYLCLIFISLIMLPLCTWTFSQNDIAYMILGFSLAVYLLFTIAISWRGFQFLNNTLKLKHENIDLTENVSAKNIQLSQMNQSLIEKENNLRLIHDHAPIGMAVMSLDGKWLNVNTKLCDIVGYSKEELQNMTIHDITYQDDTEIGLESRENLLSGKISSYQMEKRYVHKNGQLIWILTNVSLVLDKDGKPLYFISQIQDINDRKENERIIAGLSNMNKMLQLCHNSKEAYPIISHAAQELFSGLSGGLAILNKLTNEQETMIRWGDHPLLKSSFKPVDCWAFRAGNTYVVNDVATDSICDHFESLPSNGYVCLPLIVQSQVIGMLNFNASEDHNITHYQQQIINNFSEIIKLSLANINLNEALRDQAIHDPLTGLYNRRYLSEWLPQMLQNALRAKSILCLCMLDLDFFKRVNDVHGHDAGDEVLKFIGTLLKNSFRESDIACRFGGEEFVVVITNSNLKQAVLLMEHIRAEIKTAQIHVQDQTLPPITISIGIAEAPLHGATSRDILRAADSALYAAKEAGRDRIVTARSEVERST